MGADRRSVPLHAYFRTGQYEGEFREFDSSGLPTQMADGSPVSNRLRKKLEKKLEKHERRLAGLDSRNDAKKCT
jgi:hypothetical protein